MLVKVEGDTVNLALSRPLNPDLPGGHRIGRVFHVPCNLPKAALKKARRNFVLDCCAKVDQRRTAQATPCREALFVLWRQRQTFQLDATIMTLSDPESLC